jgi:hypothetical protein
VKKRVVFIEGLKDELWNAFADGGELEWIRDLELMHVISFAYHYVRRITYFERLYLQVKFLIGRDSVFAPETMNELIENLMILDPIALDHIDLALQRIHARIPVQTAQTGQKIQEPTTVGSGQKV